MRAIVQEGSGSADVLKLREIERPVVGDKDVLVRVRAASVNALDGHLLKMPLPVRKLFARKQPVRIPGVDLAGHIEAVGRKVTRFKPADEVFGNGRGAFAECASARGITASTNVMALRGANAA
jgi:NADPH:quinone reductase-like Zn-dependent oxidoreductase